MARPVHKGITPSRVVDVAWKIVDADGLAALTMRRLGTDLGVAAMAVYNHFPDRDAILDAIAERALAELLSEPSTGDWRKRLRRIVAGVHGLADKHPHVFEVVVSRPSRPRAFLPLMTESLDALRQAGLSRRRAVQWYHTFLMLIHGYATWRAALERYAIASPAGADLSELPPEQQEDWRAVHSVSAKSQFDHAVELLMNTLERERDRSLT